MDKLKFLKLLLLMVFTSLLAACSAPQVPRLVFPSAPDEPKYEFISTHNSEVSFRNKGFTFLLDQATGVVAELPFLYPQGAALVGEGKLLVSDPQSPVNFKLYDFGAEEVEGYRKGKVQHPSGMASDSAGRIYVADSPAKKIVVFSAQMELLREFSVAPQLEMASYVALDEERQRIYVSDGLGGKIGVFDLQGAYHATNGSKGIEEGQFHGPQGMAIDGEGRLFVADMMNARVQVFDAESQFLYQFGVRGDQPAQMEAPKDLAFDSEGHLYVVDQRKGIVTVRKPDGALLMWLGLAGNSMIPFDFVSPVAIKIDRQDRIYVIDNYARRIAIWQYLNEAYLAANPFTEEDDRRLEEYIQKMAEESEAARGK